MDNKNYFSSEICQKIYTETHDGILITDKSGTILKCNPALSKITGYSNEELIGKNPSILKSDQHDKSYQSHLP